MDKETLIENPIQRIESCFPPRLLALLSVVLNPIQRIESLDLLRSKSHLAMEESNTKN